MLLSFFLMQEFFELQFDWSFLVGSWIDWNLSRQGTKFNDLAKSVTNRHHIKEIKAFWRYNPLHVKKCKIIEFGKIFVTNMLKYEKEKK